MANKYFLYSREQYEKRVEIEKKIGRKYVPGVVLIKGEERRFTEMSDKFNSRFKDVVVVYQGDPSSIRYVAPKVINIGRG